MASKTTKKTVGTAAASKKKRTAAKKTSGGKLKYVGDKSAQKNAATSANKQYVYTIVFAAAAVMFSCIACIPGENLWAGLRGAAFAFFGVGFFVLTVFCFILAIMVSVRRTERKPAALVASMMVLVILIVTLIHVISNHPSEAGGVASWIQDIKNAASGGWNVSANGVVFNGGILGAALGGCLLYSCGRAPSIAIVIVLIIVNGLLVGVSAMNMFGLSVRQTLNDKSENRKSAAAIRHEERKALRESRHKKKQELAQQRHEAHMEALRHESEKPKVQKTDKKASNTPPMSGSDDELPAGDTQYVSINDLLKIDDSVFGYSEQRRAEKPKNDEKVGYKRPVLSMPLEMDELDDDEYEAAQAVQAKLGGPIGGAAPQKRGDNSDVPDDIINSAVNNAKQRSEQTKAALDSYIDHKTKSKHTYELPPVECLNAPVAGVNADNATAKEIRETSLKLLEALRSFNVETKLVGVSRGPSVTRYELQPAPGVKIIKITRLADDIALRLASNDSIRIEGHIPNKSAIGIEIPNKIRSTVTMREMVVSDEYRSAQSKINVALGKDVTGNINCADLAKMPHLLIAGTTGSGKSVCLNCMIVSILYNATPDEVKMILIDPKQVEFTVYNGIPHLLVPVITNARKASGALAWAVAEMEKRYNAFSECGVRDIKGFNKYCKTHTEYSPMPLIVIFIDELNDLMMVSPKEVEDSICRLAQKARAAGMHLVVATQRPSVNVITGIIKANIPSRISLSVSSQVDSRTILDSIGAERLLGTGDMLYSPVGTSKPLRLQGAFLSDEEIETIVGHIKNQESGNYDAEIMDEIDRQTQAVLEKNKGSSSSDEPSSDGDLLTMAAEVIVNAQVASTTLLQRKLKLGYARAARIMDELYEKGYVSAADGSKPRQVLITPQQLMEIRSSTPNDNY